MVWRPGRSAFDSERKRETRTSRTYVTDKIYKNFYYVKRN